MRAWIIGVLSLACDAAAGDAIEPPEPRAAPKPAATFDAALEVITADRLRADVEALSDDALRGRATPSEGLDRAAQYVAARFGDTGLLHVRGAPRYLQTFRCGGTEPSSNVVGMLPGRDPELRREAVLVTAHYDHLGESDDGESGDTIFNGANDNASGVAAMIGIAEAFARVMEPPRRSVVFVAFCGEEMGMRGSKHWIRRPLWPLSDTTAVVNLEMLGRADAPLVWITGHELSTLPTAFHDEARFVASSEIGDAEADTFERSDNLPFAREGIVAHTFAAGRLDELYHAVADEASTLDYDRMAVIVRALARGIHRVAETPAPPRWTSEGRAAGYAK